MLVANISDDDWLCVLCYQDVNRVEDHSAWVLTETGGPFNTSECVFKHQFGESSYLIHISCFMAAVRSLGERRIRSKLWWLNETRRFLWPVPRYVRGRHTREMASDIISTNPNLNWVFSYFQ